jgi:anti-anti-sigma factor
MDRYGISIGSRGEWIVVELSGEIDAVAAHQLHLLGEPISYMGDLPVEIDLTRVTSIHAQGLGEIQELVVELLAAARGVRVVNVSDEVRQVLENASDTIVSAIADYAMA